MIEFKKSEECLVEAIEQGKIVKVSESYARREGLLVLRRPPQVSAQTLTLQQKKDEASRKNKGFIGMDDLRKPLNPEKSEVIKELVENFHWILTKKRRDRLLTRKKVADAIKETEINIKMIENGVLPANNFILVNKLESYYGINLRRNKVAESKTPLRQIIEFAKKQAEEKKESEEKKPLEEGKEKEEAVLDLNAKDAEVDMSKL